MQIHLTLTLPNEMRGTQIPNTGTMCNVNCIGTNQATSKGCNNPTDTKSPKDQLQVKRSRAAGPTWEPI